MMESLQANHWKTARWLDVIDKFFFDDPQLSHLVRINIVPVAQNAMSTPTVG